MYQVVTICTVLWNSTRTRWEWLAESNSTLPTQSVCKAFRALNDRSRLQGERTTLQYFGVSRGEAIKELRIAYEIPDEAFFPRNYSDDFYTPRRLQPEEDSRKLADWLCYRSWRWYDPYHKNHHWHCDRPNWNGDGSGE